MTKVSDLLAELLDHGVRLRLEDGKLLSDAPKGALTPERLNAIRARKSEIVAFLSRASEGAAQVPPIDPVDRGGDLPLSFAQQRAWFLEQIQPGCPIHNIPSAWTLSGRLDVRALRAAFTALIGRHEVLRQRFGERDGQPILRIVPAHEFDLALVDVSAAPDSLAQRIDAATRTPFDLHGQAPLIRATLYRLSDTDHVLYVLPHHIIWDGWSFELMLSELAESYAATLAGQPSGLAELPIQYVDYAAWERELLSGKALERDAAYWAEQLAGDLPVLEVATDFTRPEAITYEGSSESMVMPSELAERVRVLASETSSTPYMVGLAALGLLLSRYSNQDDILIGCPIENSMRPELEPLIGYFVNMLVMRIRLDHDATFADLVAATKQTSLDAFEHQNLPFERLVEQLNVRRDTSRNPVFQAMFLYQDATERPESFAGLSVAPFDVAMPGAQADAFFWLERTHDRWLLGVDYSTDLFRPDTARRMLSHMLQLLDAATRDSGARLRDLDMLSAAETHDLLVARNASARTLPTPSLLHSVIEAQVDRGPDRVAVSSGDRSLTYAQLDTRANRLAHKLLGLKLGPNALVGVSLERDTDLVVALLGIHKAGGAYLPLDPEFPEERVEYMRADSGAPLVLTEDELDDLDEFPTHRPTVAVADSDLAYMIYTSGSTGRPKGVQLSHANAVNLVTAMAERPGLATDDVLLAVTTLSFDISVLELFLPLSVGAHVVVATADEAADGELLLERMTQCGVTVMQATPATWRMLLDSDWTGDASLRVLCGGEAMPLDLAQTLAGCCGELWNMYGPTETTVWSTCARIAPDVDSIRIGSPIANTQVYVLDERGRPTPPGVPGELFIGGLGVARGYHNRPELTAERFVADPFADGEDARMYRTGDRARWHADGTMECLGRLDNQVKVRGFRIELGEIETVLTSHDVVDQAVVGVSQPGTDDARLVAYVVFRGGDLTVSEVRRFLRKRLPDYMIPGLVVDMDRLPLTANGKVDRKALPDPTAGANRRSRDYKAPATPHEELISDVWRDLLGVERVGSNDNFYEIGGHSLLSLRAVVEIQKRSGRRLDPRAMFFQTVEQLAQGLDVRAD